MPIAVAGDKNGLLRLRSAFVVTRPEDCTRAAVPLQHLQKPIAVRHVFVLHASEDRQRLVGLSCIVARAIQVGDHLLLIFSQRSLSNMQIARFVPSKVNEKNATRCTYRLMSAKRPGTK